MKNRKLIYILLPVTVVIWGMIIYKVLSWMDKDRNKKSTPVTIVNKNLAPAFIDTFSLLNNYPDPFGSHSALCRKSNSVVGKDGFKKKWPIIFFYGTFTIGKQRSILTSVQINGNDLIMKPGDICNGMRLIKVKKESILVSYCGEERKINREPENR